ncbi:MAG: DUF4136 domain-containing protein [Gemmatimonadota bacterium]|nr:DUF4136 domain-containing protein [Gemmatimonadota bacterium]
MHSRSRSIFGPSRASWLVALAALGGCASTNVNTQAAPDVSFTEMSTYAWLPNPPLDMGEIRPMVGRIVRTAVEEELAALGFTPDPISQPDFWVSTFVAAGQTEVETTWAFYGPRYDWISVLVGADVGFYREGTLILDLLDGRSRELIWRGVATATVEQGQRAAADAERRVADAVQAMLAELP